MSRLWQALLAALTLPLRKGPGRNGSPAMPPKLEVRKGAGATVRAPASRPEQAPTRPAGRFAPVRKLWLWVARHRMILLMMVGGAVGTLARYLIGKWFGSQPWAQGFPYGTLFINVTGSFILAAAGVVILERLPPEHQDWFLLIGTGFCGGYTTFSSFEWETFKLVRDRLWLAALGNVVGSVLAGFVGVLLGVGLAVVFFPKR